MAFKPMGDLTEFERKKLKKAFFEMSRELKRATRARDSFVAVVRKHLDPEFHFEAVTDASFTALAEHLGDKKPGRWWEKDNDE